ARSAGTSASSDVPNASSIGTSRPGNCQLAGPSADHKLARSPRPVWFGQRTSTRSGTTTPANSFPASAPEYIQPACGDTTAIAGEGRVAPLTRAAASAATAAADRG